jgi:two-component system cell cycle sensor histidine kinase/response regulator CckA
MAQHIRILMVEDSPHDAELIQRELRRAKLDFSSERVETEKDFRAALDSTDPDVILGDYNLPGFDGVEALKIASSLVPATPFIFVSGSIGEERAVQTLREGAVDYILKDRLSRLASAIIRALDQRRDRQLRRRAQEALQRSEERFQYAAGATREVIRDWDMPTGKISVNEALNTVWGYGLAVPEVDVEWWKSRVHPDERAVVIASLEAALARDDRWSGAYRFQRADGSYGHVDDRALIVRDSKGQAKRVISAMLDMTERAIAEETIRRLSRQNEAILEYAAEGIYAMSRNGKVVTANPATLKMTGFSAAEILAAPNVHDLIHHSRADGTPYPFSECPIHKTMQDGVVRRSQEVFWRKSGESFPVDFNCSPIYENDVITGCVVMFEDITERKRLERQLEQANRVSSLGRVAATIAHEFNNVLMGIQPFAEVIRRNTTEEKMQKAASQIINSVARGKRVTQEILRFTQPAEPAKQPVDLKDWLEQLVPELQAATGQRIRIEVEAPPEPVIVACDSAQMQQVITNMVLNARDAIPDGGTITIRIAASGGDVPAGMALLSVRDTGTGMMPGVLQNIFEPLFTTKRSGTGLGLAVAQQVVVRHGGTIHVESQPGVGTSFYIFLPVAGQAPRREQRAGSRAVRASSLLLVEDDAAVAAGIASLLESEGIHVEIVDLGAKAIEAVSASRPDAVILDVSLPDVSGVGVYEQLSKRWSDLPILFSTGHGDEATLEPYLDSPHVGFLRKPYDLQTLLDALERIIGGREVKA